MFSTDEIASLVPDAYAEYRQLAVECLLFFLAHLSPARQDQFLATLAALPPDAGVPQRIAALAPLSPALHKLGQVLSRNRHLDPALRGLLEPLESLPPTTPMSALRRILQEELGPVAERHRLRIGDSPLAEASVAVVVPCEFDSGSAGVLKILRPGIVPLVHEDLEILSRLADHLDGLQLTDIDHRGTFDEIHELLASEIDTPHEQEHLAAAGRFYAHDRDVAIPELLPFSTPRITAMTRLPGQPLNQAGAIGEPARLARRLSRALLARPLLSRAEGVLFHADPHGGNILLQPDGRLGLLDWSLTGHLSRSHRRSLARLAVAGVARDPAMLAETIASLCTAAPDAATVRQIAGRALQDQPLMPSLAFFLAILDRAAHRGLRFSPQLLLFRKSYFVIEHLIHDLDPGASLDRMLTGSFLLELLAEWPWRAFAGLADWRASSAHLSNVDLWRMAVDGPLALAGRGWL